MPDDLLRQHLHDFVLVSVVTQHSPFFEPSPSDTLNMAVAALEVEVNRAASKIERLRAINAELLANLEWATKQIGILSQYIETPEVMVKFDECCAAIAKAKGE